MAFFSLQTPVIKDGLKLSGTATIGHNSDSDLITLANGTVTFTGSTVIPTADINGGSIDGVTIGTNAACTQLVVDNVNINGATIGHTDDTDLITLADGSVTFSGASTFNAGISVKNGAGDPGYIDFYEDSVHGGHKITLAPIVGNLSGDITVRLPTSTGLLLTAGVNEFTDTQTFTCDLVLSVTAKETNNTTDSSEALGSTSTPTLLLNQYAASGTPTQTYTVGDGEADGQILHIFFSTTASTRKIRLDFQQSGTDYLLSGSGSARYLTFDTSGQSATLIYTAALTNGSVAKAWRIINTGATVT